jgi:hypothetical protein
MHNQWVIALTVTLATFMEVLDTSMEVLDTSMEVLDTSMEVLDTSIANVALPHIAGGLGASQDEATWVLTSYLVANAIILPKSAYLTGFIGRKKFYMIGVVLFGIRPQQLFHPHWKRGYLHPAGQRPCSHQNLLAAPAPKRHALLLRCRYLSLHRLRLHDPACLSYEEAPENQPICAHALIKLLISYHLETSC